MHHLRFETLRMAGARVSRVSDWSSACKLHNSATLGANAITVKSMCPFISLQSRTSEDTSSLTGAWRGSRRLTAAAAVGVRVVTEPNRHTRAGSCRRVCVLSRMNAVNMTPRATYKQLALRLKTCVRKAQQHVNVRRCLAQRWTRCAQAVW